MTILVLSCDAYSDTFEPFHYCIEKYGPDHPTIIYSTEMIINPYYKTICKNYTLSNWSKRIHDTVTEINDNKILIMCDDIFLREKVDNNYVNYISTFLTNNVASINLHESIDPMDRSYNDSLNKRSINASYKTSVMCSMGQKDKLLNVFNISRDPGKFELENHHCGYDYLINKDKKIFSFGRSKFGGIWGIYRGKWCRECLKFFEQEGISVNTARGIYD